REYRAVAPATTILLFSRKRPPRFPPGRFRAALHTLESSPASRAEGWPVLPQAWSRESFLAAFLVASFSSSARYGSRRQRRRPVENRTRSREWMEVYYLYDAILAFDQRGTAFDPIAAVIISNGPELPDGGAVDVTAENGRLKTSSRTE